MNLLSNFLRETPPISQNDSFLVYDRVRKSFNFPIHYHTEYELNFIINSKGVRRIVGDHVAETDDIELVFIGPNLYHCWETHKCTSKRIHEITIQFHHDLFDNSLLSRGIFLPIKEMFKRSKHGILFSTDTAYEFKERLMKIPKLESIDYFLEITSLLHNLAQTPNQKLLSSVNIDDDELDLNDKMKKVNLHIQRNFANKITLAEVADIANMTQNSFNRFIKKKTNKTFVHYLNDIRIGYATRWLIEKDSSISEVAFMCGFNNLANFNRIFKSIVHRTPTEYKEFFNGWKKII